MSITPEERASILRNMKALLDEYGYTHTDEALDIIVDKWSNNKGTLIEAFKKHPQYIDGKFLIAFDTDYERDIDTRAIENFCCYLGKVISWGLKNAVLPDEIVERRDRENCLYLPNKIYDLLTWGLSDLHSRILDTEQAKRINEALPEVKARAGQKTSRAINKLLTILNYHTHPDYNKEFAKYADALSPMTIKRHTVLSLNPLDYLTMSFGNSWSSCHTIDKSNRRNMPSGYQGMYSSGTMSYMLDGTSMVLYVVDKAYDGTEYYTQDKVNRQMFHYAHDKLIQGRLYPQAHDGDSAEYTAYRNIVQNIMSVIFDFPNLWKVSDDISRNVWSEGTHYRDYTNFGDCRISVRSGSTNAEVVEIGHAPICIECGEEHHTENNINCCADYVKCADCGERISRDDAYYIDGEYYCRDCTSWCDVCEERVHSNIHYICGRDVCDHCRDNYYTQCDECGEWVDNEDVYRHNGYDYCEDCWNEVIAREEDEENEEEEEEDEGTEITWKVVDRDPVCGDYIRLKIAYFTFNEVGDILRIDGVRRNGLAFVYGKNHPRDTGDDNTAWNYSRNRFEIIEKA